MAIQANECGLNSAFLSYVGLREVSGHAAGTLGEEEPGPWWGGWKLKRAKWVGREMS